MIVLWPIAFALMVVSVLPYARGQLDRAVDRVEGDVEMQKIIYSARPGSTLLALTPFFYFGVALLVNYLVLAPTP